MSLYSNFKATKDQIKVSVGHHSAQLCKYKQNFNAGYAVDKKGVQHKIIYF